MNMPPHQLYARDNHGPELDRGIWAAVAIAALIVILRVFAKIKINHFRADDVLMVLASILAIVSCVFLTLSVKHGFGKNLATIPSDDRMAVLKYIAFQILIVTISTTIARTAFIVYLLPIVSPSKKYQIALWAVLFIQLSGNIASAVLPLSMCRDARILWDPTVKTTCADQKAVVNFAYYSNSFNSFTDLFLAVFPTVVFWNLNLKLRIKISLIVLLSLGIIAMVASIIKTTKLDQVPSVTNLGGNGAVELIRWGYVENALIIITSSIPCIRPLIISSVRKISSGGFSRSYELSGPFSGNRRTGGNDTAQSRRPKKWVKNEETGSVERILEPSGTQHTRNTSVSGRGHSPEQLESGITKQVEIKVTNENEGRGL